MKPSPKKQQPPLWMMLGMKQSEKSILVMGFKQGPAAPARQMMEQRAKDEGVSEFEMFNIFDPTANVRDEIYGWLLAGGATVEDAKDTSVAVLKSVAEQLKRLRRRRGRPMK
jgi:hypothetical protein